MDRQLLTRALTDLLTEEAALDAQRQLVGDAVEAVGRVLGLPAPVTLAAVQAITVDIQDDTRGRKAAAVADRPADDVVLAALAAHQPCRPSDLMETLGQPNAQKVYWMLHRLQKVGAVVVSAEGDWRCVCADTPAAAPVDDGVGLTPGEVLQTVLAEAVQVDLAADGIGMETEVVITWTDGDDVNGVVAADEPVPPALTVVGDQPPPASSSSSSSRLDPTKLTDLVATYGDGAGIAVSGIVQLLPWAVSSRLDGNLELHHMLEDLAQQGMVQKGRGGRWAPGPNAAAALG